METMTGKKKLTAIALPLMLTVCMFFSGCSGQSADSSGTAGGSSQTETSQQAENQSDQSSASSGSSEQDDQSGSVQAASQGAPVSSSDIPAYSGQAYAEINGNVPDFSESDLTTRSYEKYGDLDSLGRCTTCIANVGQDLMPTAKRGSIGMIKPTGWHTVKYDWVDGKYLYNRCHLIGYQLTAENANEKNLITGTRYMNVDGMLPFENMIADYVKETGNHVLYRVTPVFDGSNLVAGGVHMEAESVEDKGAGVEFNVYCYNVEPGVRIDYTDGSSQADGSKAGSSGADSSGAAAAASSAGSQSAQSGTSSEQTYVLNTNTGKFHRPGCNSLNHMKASNRKTVTGSRDQLISQGCEPCKNCNP